MCWHLLLPDSSTSCRLRSLEPVFSSNTLIRLNKEAFEGHLEQTVHNLVKQNYSSIMIINNIQYLYSAL